ncbi:SGNH/GDSL hydrolase family protein [Streptomyces sp. NPDC048462]|uniref:SGNH/GDSL hydrolase family protein n=1 Tax=Streptomyces sp. NPDC048462 TaxID=3365555 RepID=UPI0037147FFE
MRTTHAARRTAVTALTTAALAVLPLTGGEGLVAPAHAAPARTGAPAQQDHGQWQGGWATSPQAPAAPFGPNWSQQGFADQTVRQVVRVSTGGTRARVELSNRYGSIPLRITGATVARTDDGASVRPGSLQQLSFGRHRSATIAAGSELTSDALPFRTRALESLTVTLHLAGPTGPATFHLMSSATSYRAQGDHRADRGGAAFTETSESWYYLTGVEVSGGGAPRRNGVVAFGDSITDGVGSTPNADNRYPDELAERFAATGKPRSVVNQGIAGNQVTNDMDWAGEKGVARFRKDALGEPGVGTVIVLEGINDIGASGTGAVGTPSPEVSVAQLIAGHRSLIRQAHAKGIRAIGATLTPIGGSSYDSTANEAKRQAVNDWIRTSGAYDAVVDLDLAVADPTDPARMTPTYDSGDHLHPNDAGYHAMARSLDLTGF